MRSRSASALRPPPPAPGFTIVEVVVAVTLLTVGALAAVAATAAAVRAVGSAESQLLATAAARDRLEDLAARGCSELSDGAAVDSGRGFRERWAVTPARNGVRLATDSIAYTDHGILRSVLLRRLIVC